MPRLPLLMVGIASLVLAANACSPSEPKAPVAIPAPPETAKATEPTPAPAAPAAPQEVPTRTVIKPKLEVRDQASATGKVLATLDRSAKVQLVDTTGAAPPAGWVKVDAGNGTVGFASVGGLTRFPVPAPETQGIDAYVATLGAEESKREAALGEGNTATIHHYASGVEWEQRHFKSGDDTINESHLRFPNPPATLEETFWIGCALTSACGADRTFQPVVADGVQKVNDDSAYQIIAVNPYDGGFDLMFPERAD